MRLTEGSEFAGYTILGLLGAGAMGEVYLAQHPRLPRHEALKVLPLAVSSDAAYRERFIREADLAAALWHTNIVGVRDRGDYNGQLWMSMEYVAGINADERLRQSFPSGMPVRDVIDIVTAVANALDYAHKQGLLHRDVKPANIILGHTEDDTEQRIMLADFGIARRVDDTSGLTATNMAVGSIAYAAPEQLTGDHIDGRADQYALAATAYQLLTGTPLFHHENPAVVIGRHLNTEPPRLGEARPELVALEPVLARALAKSPDQRYSQCKEFAEALAQHADTAVVAAAGAATALSNPIPAAVESPIAPAVSSRAVPHASSLRRTATLVPVLLALVFAGSATFAAIQFVNVNNAKHIEAKPQWQPYVDFGKAFTEHFMTLDTQTGRPNLQPLAEDTVGRFHDDFGKKIDDFRQTAIRSGATTPATVKGAALKSYSERSETAEVLVDATSAWRIRLTVEKIGDTYKVSELVFVK